MRPIDADNIVQVAEHAYNEWNLAMATADGRREINHVYKMQELCKAVRAVANAAPTITLDDLIPHGRWIPTGTNNAIGPLVRCSSCGKYINPSATAIELNRQKLEPKFCENCGAKMDKEE